MPLLHAGVSDQDDVDDYVVVGRIGQAHGLRGEVSVEPRTDEPERRFAAGRGAAQHRRAADADRRSGSRWHSGRLRGPLRGDRRPHRGRGGPRHRAATADRPGRARPRTPRSSTTTSWSGCAVETDDGEPVGELARIEHDAAQDLLVDPYAGPRGALPVRHRAGARGRPRRRPDRLDDRPGSCCEEDAVMASTSSRSSPTTSPRSGLSLPGKAQADRPARRARPRPARLDPRPPPHGRRHAVRRRRRHGDEARALGRGARRGRARRRRPSSCRPRPGEPFTQALAAELATREHLVFACGRYEGIDQRVVDDGRRAAGGARGLARRLRAQRRRGRRAGDHRGRRTPAARVHGQRRVAGRGVARRRACWSTPSTPSPPPGAATTCPRCCCPATTPGSPPGATTSPYAVPPSAVPTSPTPRGRSTSSDAGREIRLAEPADAGELFTLQRACWVQEQQANPGVAHPRAARGPRRRRRPGSATVDHARRCASAAGSSARSAAARDGDEWDVGRLMVAPDLAGPRPRPAAARARSRPRRRTGARRLRAVHRRRQRAQPADVQEGRLPPARRGPEAPGRRTADQAPALSRSAISPLWPTRSRVAKSLLWPSWPRSPATGGRPARRLALDHPDPTTTIRG